jgi:hypothetical protein
MKKAVVGFGRMNPSTTGHEVVASKIAAEARKRNAEARLYLSHTTNPKKDPLPYDDKVKFATAAFKHLVKVINSPARTIIEVAVELEKQGFTEMTVVVGEDRVREFNTLLQKYNGKDFTFDKIEVIKAGDRDPDADDVTGMSASKMRKLASEGDFEAFAKGAPSKLSKAMVKQMYDKVRKNMRIAEMFELDSDQEILDEFTVISSYSKKELDDKLKIFTKRKDKYRKLIRTPLSDDFDVYYYESGGFHEYIFTEKDTEEPVGQFEIEIPFDSKRPKFLKPGIKIVTPHLSFVEKYQRKGLARKTYLAFLRTKNYVFKSDRHTKEAASLWDSLAKERDIVTFYYDEESGEVSKTKMDTGIDEVKFLGVKSDFNLPKDINEACWVGYTQKGLKKKGNRMVPNCVPEEKTDEAVLSYAQRRARAQRLRRMQKRLQRTRALQMKRVADPKRLQKRARRSAFKFIRRRLGAGKNYTSLGTSQKIAVDKRLQKFLPAIKKISARLLPSVRRKELLRKRGPKNEMFEEFMLEKGPSRYYKGLAQDTKEKRAAHFKKMGPKPDDDQSAYTDAPGDKEAREKGMPQSQHTKKYKQMYGEEVNKKEMQRLDMLVRMGLADKKLLQIIKRSISKLDSGEMLNPQERKAAFDLLQTLLDMTLSTDQLFSLTRRQLQKEETLTELSYKGNVGIMEFARFFEKASAQQIAEMKKLLSQKKTAEALKLLHNVTGTKLQENYDDYDKIDGLRMAQIEVANLMQDADILLNLLDQMDEEPEAWVLSKITKAVDYIESVTDYLEFEDVYDYDDEDDDDDEEEDDEDDMEDEIEEILMDMVNEGELELDEEFKELFEEIDGLKKKAEKSGISYGILKQVYNRGMAAWQGGHRPGTTPQQWAFARVNSFITKGKGTWGGADSDLASKVKKNEEFVKQFSEAQELGTDASRIAYARMTPGQNIDLVTAKYTDKVLNVLNDIRTQRMKKLFDEQKDVVTEAIQMHLEKKIPFTENVFHFGSENYFEFFRKARELHESKLIELSDENLKLIEETDLGKFAEYEGKMVPLDCPMCEEELNEAEYQGKDVKLNDPFRTPGGPRKFAVYTMGPNGKVVIVRFGDPNMEIKRDDPARRASFRARHGCDDPGPKYKAKYWSCYQWRAGAKVDS